MDAARLEQLGKAMYGTFWQSEVAHALGKASRTVRFWATGTRPVPDTEAERLEALARRRLELLKHALQS